MTVKEIAYQEKVTRRTVHRWLRLGIVRYLPASTRYNRDVVKCHTLSFDGKGQNI